MADTATESAILERLERLESVAEIQQLILDYRKHLFARDLGSYSQLFCRDGEWSGPHGRAVGPEGIRALLDATLEPNPPAPGATAWHFLSLPEISVGAHRATATTTWTLIQRDPDDTPTVSRLGRYEDVFEREDGRWKFKRRNCFIEVPAD
jgi:hypothetical protein